MLYAAKTLFALLSLLKHSNLVLELHKNLRLFEIEVFLPNTLVFSKKPFHIFTWVCNLNYFPRLISLSSCYIVQFSKYNFEY